VQPPVLLGERLAAALQVLAVHLRLLQLRPARVVAGEENVRGALLGEDLTRAKPRIDYGREICIFLYLALRFWNQTSTWRGRRLSCFASATFCFCKVSTSRVKFAAGARAKVPIFFHGPMDGCLRG
jgi:hypothetical protein